MAQSEHLPIYKCAYDFCLYFEQVVRGFSPSIRVFQALLGTVGVSPYRGRIGGLMTGNRAW